MLPLKKLKIGLTIVLLILVLYTITTFASIGRFSTTHAVVRESNCTNCHVESIIELDSNRHIGSHSVNVGNNQSIAIDYYVNMAQSVDINGICMSCHNGKKKLFGMVDPYIYNFSGNNISVINGIGFWDSEWETNLTPGSSNETIIVTVEAQDIFPDTNFIIVDATVQLMNFSGQQNSSKLSANVVQSLYKGDNLTVVRSDIYGDYFRVYIDVTKPTSFYSLKVSVNGYPSIVINSSDGGSGSGSNFYNLPVDLSLQYSYLALFHTQGNYTIKRMDRTINDMANSSVMSISTNEIMEDYIGNSSRYTCGSPGAMCHIQNRITYLGQTFGFKNGRYYAHEMEYATTKTCKTCHI